MAGASLLALLDDITALMDDVGVMTKVAARKTAGVLGDDLAVNAEKVTGVAAERELPVVFAVFRGSLLNKAILVPAALVVATFASWLIGPLLIAGGLFLCFEGFEKVWHWLFHRRDPSPPPDEAEIAKRLAVPDTPALEQQRIRGAVRTDFILSAEIIVITLGIVGDEPLLVRAAVLSTIALVMTLGVYGLVAAIVKMDDVGAHFAKRPSVFVQGIGRALLAFAPRLMQTLTYVGTIAMFLVGGGILVHGVPSIHHALEVIHAQLGLDAQAGLDGGARVAAALLPHLFALGVGVLAGAIVLLAVTSFGKARVRLSA